MLQLGKLPIFTLDMNNTRFATAIHILTLLASEPEQWLSSEYIAGSININPVMVRKELSVLLEAGLVITKKGKDGGARLSKDSKEILLSDIYTAVNKGEILGRKHINTNMKCSIGKQINAYLSVLFEEIDQRTLLILKEKSLADFQKQFK